MVGTTLWLPRTLHRRVAIAAMDDGKAVAVAVREALRLWLAARRKRRTTR